MEQYELQNRLVNKLEQYDGVQAIALGDHRCLSLSAFLSASSLVAPGGAQYE